MDVNFGQGSPNPRPYRKPKSPAVRILISVAVTLVVGLIYFYLSLPALNLQSTEFYTFVILLCVVYGACALILSGTTAETPQEYFKTVKKQCKLPIFVGVGLAALFVVGNIISMPIFRAGAYRELITITTGDFATDVSELSFDKLPLLDRDSAERLGDRKLGELADMVSQFEVSNDYTQINYQDRPVRVTPLVYGDLIKWFNNRKEGLPAYILTDMANQNVEVVRLTDGMKYTPDEHFSRYLPRHLRFNYPTFMFADATFEINDEGEPFWICPRIVKKIGLFGGVDVNGAVLVNAVTGENEYYEEVPSWVDRVYIADLIIQQYDYYGLYVNGFINSIFGQKGVTKTTDRYNYIALNDDVYVYTGVTSVGGDQSNIGFLLSNQRTKETKYYPCAGADENSAMVSAMGVVQHLGYTATSPLLLNISGQATYFMSLKDNAQLVKMYAMVNVGQYQVVAVGATVADCEKEYLRLMAANNITQAYVPEEKKVDGVVTEVKEAVKNGTSYYYFKLDTDSYYYVISATESETAVLINVGDRVKIEADEAESDVIRKAYAIEIVK